MNFHGMIWILMDFYGFYMDFDGFSLNDMDFDRF